jgi:putative hydrolase of HD superfamily
MSIKRTKNPKSLSRKEVRKLVSFLFEIGSLRKVIRSHQQMLLTFDLSDTISSHSFRVAFTSYFLAKALGADADKAMKIAIVHDMEEARSSDHNWVHKKYVKVFDNEIITDQLRDMPEWSRELRELAAESHERKTIEGKIVKDADLLDQLFLLREYDWQGNKEAREWLKGSGQLSRQEQLMHTALAKAIAKEVKKQAPSDWWSKSWTHKRR